MLFNFVIAKKRTKEKTLKNWRKEKMSEEKKRPEFKSRVGAIETNVWEQKGKSGDFFTISFQRSYMDEDSGTWKTTQVLRVSDIQDLKLGLSDCHRFCKQVSKNKKSDEEVKEDSVKKSE